MGYVGFLLPVLEVAAIAWLVSRIAYQRYPALLTYLGISAAAQTVVLLAPLGWTPTWASVQPFLMVARAAVVVEVFRFACVRMSTGRKLQLAGLVVAICAAATGVICICTSLTPWQTAVIFREHYYLILAGALVGLCIHRAWGALMFRLHPDTADIPVPENRDHKAYRWGATAQAIATAAGGIFTEGGFGWMVLPYSRTLHEILNAALWGAACVIVAGLAYAMTSCCSCFRPEKAFADMDLELIFAYKGEKYAA